MKPTKISPFMGAIVVLAASTALQAQTTTPPSTPGTLPDSPSTAKPSPSAPPSVTPTTPAPSVERSAKDTKTDPLVGLAVFGSDGQKLGEVQDVKTESDGKVREIHIKTGGFLGFGGRMVAIPSDKFTRSGQNVQVNMTYNEVTALPKIEDKRS